VYSSTHHLTRFGVLKPTVVPLRRPPPSIAVAISLIGFPIFAMCAWSRNGFLIQSRGTRKAGRPYMSSSRSYGRLGAATFWISDTRSTFTRAKPTLANPSACAAPRERSMMRFESCGPRSLIVTLIVRPLSRLVTRTTVPKGSVRCAAVIPHGSNISPLAVRWPARAFPYHEAIPTSDDPVGAEASGGIGAGCSLVV